MYVYQHVHQHVCQHVRQHVHQQTHTDLLEGTSSQSQTSTEVFPRENALDIDPPLKHPSLWIETLSWGYLSPLKGDGKVQLEPQETRGARQRSSKKEFVGNSGIAFAQMLGPTRG